MNIYVSKQKRHNTVISMCGEKNYRSSLQALDTSGKEKNSLRLAVILLVNHESVIRNETFTSVLEMCFYLLRFP